MNSEKGEISEKVGSTIAETHNDSRLGEILLSQNVITSDNLELAKKEMLARGISLRRALSGLDICLEDEINWAISRELDIPFVLLSKEMIEDDLIKLFPINLLLSIEAIPIGDALGGITLVMTDPLDEVGLNKLQRLYDGELHIAVAPGGRVKAVLEYVQSKVAPVRTSSIKIDTKDSSGVATVYGMIVDARFRKANRILIRPSGDGLEALFRLEHGWIVYRLWDADKTLMIVSRCRIMMGLPPVPTSAKDSASLNARIDGERLVIEAEFIRDTTGITIDFHIFPIISSPTLAEFSSLSEEHRNALLGVLSARRPTGVVLVNAADQRQRYRMIYGILAMLGKRNLDILAVEERKFIESQQVRRFQVKTESQEWEEAISHEGDVLAIPDAPYWRWRDIISNAGQKLIILGMDLANSWLAFTSFLEVIDSRIVMADRWRALWSGKRVDLTCTVCGGIIDPNRGTRAEGVCPECDGYGHSRGIDFYEVVVPNDSLRDRLLSEIPVTEFRREFNGFICTPTITEQLNAGIKEGLVFNAVDKYE